MGMSSMLPIKGNGLGPGGRGRPRSLRRERRSQTFTASIKARAAKNDEDVSFMTVRWRERNVEVGI